MDTSDFSEYTAATTFEALTAIGTEVAGWFAAGEITADEFAPSHNMIVDSKDGAAFVSIFDGAVHVHVPQTETNALLKVSVELPPDPRVVEGIEAMGTRDGRYDLQPPAEMPAPLVPFYEASRAASAAAHAALPGAMTAAWQDIVDGVFEEHGPYIPRSSVLALLRAFSDASDQQQSAFIVATLEICPDHGDDFDACPPPTAGSKDCVAAWVEAPVSA